MTGILPLAVRESLRPAFSVSDFALYMIFEDRDAPLPQSLFF